MNYFTSVRWCDTVIQLVHMSWTHLSNYRLICDAFCLRLVTKYHREIKRVYIIKSWFPYIGLKLLETCLWRLRPWNKNIKLLVNICFRKYLRNKWSRCTHLSAPYCCASRERNTHWKFMWNSFSHEVKCAWIEISFFSSFGTRSCRITSYANKIKIT